jgi:uncharacterized glyoxalase superfamily protein PhnB
MKIQSFAPILWTYDLDKSIQFYHDAIGFECINRLEGWTSMKTDETELMLSLPNSHEPFDKIQFTGSFYFSVDNVAGFWEQGRSKTTVVYPIEDFEYGMREFALRDNNGYILQFGQEIPGQNGCVRG